VVRTDELGSAAVEGVEFHSWVVEFIAGQTLGELPADPGTVSEQALETVLVRRHESA